jgi:anti-sigma B factor antagonist
MRPLPMVEKGGVLVVSIGEDAAFNEGQATSVRTAIYAAIASRTTPRMALDLAGIDFISSTGIALLIGTKRRIDTAQGRLVLFNLHPDILELFGTMRLTALFDIAGSEEEALSHFPSLPAT